MSVVWIKQYDVKDGVNSCSDRPFETLKCNNQHRQNPSEEREKNCHVRPSYHVYAYFHPNSLTPTPVPSSIHHPGSIVHHQPKPYAPSPNPSQRRRPAESTMQDKRLDTTQPKTAPKHRPYRLDRPKCRYACCMIYRSDVVRNTM